MIKATIIKASNNRLSSPSVNASKKNPLEKNEEIEIEAITIGDPYENNNVWYKLTDNSYVWSGAVSVDKKLSSLPTLRYGWHIEDFGINDIWKKTKGKGVKVAVIDSGLNLDHPLINSENVIATKNFLYEGSDVKKQQDVTDSDGHGTHCTGIIASQGACGVAPEVELIIAKVYEKATDGCKDKLLINAVEWSVKQGAQIVSVSIAIVDENRDSHIALSNLQKEIPFILISSLMNNQFKFYLLNVFPSNFSNGIAVGASSKNDLMYNETPWSEKVDFVAPGENIISLSILNDYRIESGCSMATPFVAGILALFISLQNSPFDLLELQEKFLEFYETKIPLIDNTEILYPLLQPKKITS